MHKQLILKIQNDFELNYILFFITVIVLYHLNKLIVDIRKNYYQLKYMINKNTYILNKLMNEYNYYYYNKNKYDTDEDNESYTVEDIEDDVTEDNEDNITEDDVSEDDEDDENDESEEEELNYDIDEEEPEEEQEHVSEEDEEIDESEDELSTHTTRISSFKMNYISKIINNCSEDDIKKIVKVCSKKILIPTIYTKNDLNNLTIYNISDNTWNKIRKTDFTYEIDTIIYNYIDE